MYAVAIHPAQSAPAAVPAVSYPVPGKHEGASEPFVTRRALIWSLSLHLILVFVGLILSWRSDEAVVATPQTFDITLVPLSALDTVVPQGTGQTPAQPKPLEPVKSPPVTLKKKVEPNKAELKPKTKKEVISPRKDLSKAPTTPSQTEAVTTSAAASHSGATSSLGSPTSTSSEPARISYQDMIATLLARAKRYPERALRRNATGDGSIRILIAASGEVSDVQIVQSTSSPILDEELRQMVERAAPFPPFPTDLHRDSLALVVPISFRLER